MRRRVRYIRDALREGAKFLYAVLSLASLVTGVALVAVLDLPPWAVAVIVPIALLAAVAEGGYRLQSKQREQLPRWTLRCKLLNCKPPMLINDVL